jgi:hypothetical protein
MAPHYHVSLPGMPVSPFRTIKSWMIGGSEGSPMPRIGTSASHLRHRARVCLVLFHLSSVFLQAAKTYLQRFLFFLANLLSCILDCILTLHVPGWELISPISLKDIFGLTSRVFLCCTLLLSNSERKFSLHFLWSSVWIHRISCCMIVA